MKLSNLFNGNTATFATEVDILLCVLVIRCLLLLVYLYLYVKHQTSSKYAVNEKVHREVKVNDINMSQYSLLTLCCLQGGNSVEGQGCLTESRIRDKKYSMFLKKKRKCFSIGFQKSRCQTAYSHCYIYFYLFSTRNLIMKPLFDIMNMFFFKIPVHARYKQV